MKDLCNKTKQCPISEIKLSKLPNNKLQLLYAPIGQSEYVLTDKHI